jgi:hypothetical protein
MKDGGQSPNHQTGSLRREAEAIPFDYEVARLAPSRLMKLRRIQRLTVSIKTFSIAPLRIHTDAI